MSEKPLEEEKLDCKKKYLYEYSMFWECNDGSKCQILEDDVVGLLNDLSEENGQLKKQLQMIKRIIQTQITEREEDLQISIKAGMPTGGMYSEIESLKELKKECFDVFDRTKDRKIK